MQTSKVEEIFLLENQDVSELYKEYYRIKQLIYKHESSSIEFIHTSDFIKYLEVPISSSRIVTRLLRLLKVQDCLSFQEFLSFCCLFILSSFQRMIQLILYSTDCDNHRIISYVSFTRFMSVMDPDRFCNPNAIFEEFTAASAHRSLDLHRPPAISIPSVTSHPIMLSKSSPALSLSCSYQSSTTAIKSRYHSPIIVPSAPRTPLHQSLLPPLADTDAEVEADSDADADADISNPINAIGSTRTPTPTSTPTPTPSHRPLFFIGPSGSGNGSNRMERAPSPMRSLTFSCSAAAHPSRRSHSIHSPLPDPSTSPTAQPSFLSPASCHPPSLFPEAALVLSPSHRVPFGAAFSKTSQPAPLIDSPSAGYHSPSRLTPPAVGTTVSVCCASASPKRQHRLSKHVSEGAEEISHVSRTLDSLTFDDLYLILNKYPLMLEPFRILLPSLKSKVLNESFWQNLISREQIYGFVEDYRSRFGWSPPVSLCTSIRICLHLQQHPFQFATRRSAESIERFYESFRPQPTGAASSSLSDSQLASRHLSSILEDARESNCDLFNTASPSILGKAASLSRIRWKRVSCRLQLAPAPSQPKRSSVCSGVMTQMTPGVGGVHAD